MVVVCGCGGWLFNKKFVFWWVFCGILINLVMDYLILFFLYRMCLCMIGLYFRNFIFLGVFFLFLFVVQKWLVLVVEIRWILLCLFVMIVYFLDFFVVCMQFSQNGINVVFVDGVQGMCGNMKFDLVVFVGNLEVVFVQVGQEMMMGFVVGV